MREVRPEQHGTRTAYSYGCRCSECTIAASDARRRARHTREGARLDVLCWCESGLVRGAVLVSDIAAGLTGACYRQHCQTLDRVARAEHSRRKAAA